MNSDYWDEFLIIKNKEDKLYESITSVVDILEEFYFYLEDEGAIK